MTIINKAKRRAGLYSAWTALSGAIVLAAFLLAGCATNYAGMALSGVTEPPASAQIKNFRGETLDLFWIDTTPNPEKSLFFVSGSGCASLIFFLRSYFRGFAPGYRIYAVQKPGVKPLDTGLLCSRDFNSHYTFDNLLGNNSAALASLPHGPFKTPVAIIGVSEGGSFAANLAAEHPEIKRLVVIGSGGMRFREELMTLAKRKSNGEHLRRKLDKVAADPNNPEATVLGLPHRYLSSMLDVDPVPAFLRVNQPIILIMGGNDDSVPVESTQVLQHAFAGAGKTNLDVRIVPGASHALTHDGKDLKPGLMADIGRFIEE